MGWAWAGLAAPQGQESATAATTRHGRAWRRDLGPMGCQDWEVAELLVPLFRARVQVSLRPSVLDPAGEATRAAASRLGVEGIQRLRIGKAIEVELEAPDRATAQQRMERLSDRLLANPVIEDWSLDLAEEG
jgi:phosphoribosylformylglycinamidine synthase